MKEDEHNMVCRRRGKEKQKGTAWTKELTVGLPPFKMHKLLKHANKSLVAEIA